jgi:hypothetical protein
MAGHLMATMGLAGTLGLPFATTAAAAADQLFNTWFGRDDIDTTGMYRTYLASAFGPQVADVIARGLPRAFGMDLSKLGDQNLLHKLLPGSQIFLDKRKFEDASKDALKDIAGVVPADFASMALGARDMLNGDILFGSMKMLPEGLKGLAESYSFYKNGFIDKDGRKYPMDPGPMSLLMAALGFDPVQLSQYQEAHKIQLGLQAQRQVREQNISRHLALAFNQNDPIRLQNWMQEAAKYQQQHIGLGPGPLGGFAQNIRQQIMEPAMARAMGMPLGVKPLDFGMRRAVGFLPRSQ